MIIKTRAFSQRFVYKITNMLDAKTNEKPQHYVTNILIHNAVSNANEDPGLPQT